MIKSSAVLSKNKSEGIAIAEEHTGVGVFKSVGTGVISRTMIVMVLIGSGLNSCERGKFLYFVLLLTFIQYSYSIYVWLVPISRQPLYETWQQS